MVASGLSTLDFLADGACEGSQKLGKFFARPWAIFEIDDVLVLGWSTVRYKQNYYLSKSIQMFWSSKHFELTKPCCHNIFLGADEFL